MLSKWEKLPSYMQCDEVREYYDILKKRAVSLVLKRIFDVLVSIIMLIILALPMLIIAVLIKMDSPGPVFYRQERVTVNGRVFRIFKFRTMVDGAERAGASVTVGSDPRITRIGSGIRGLRLDELPQLIDVLIGNMSFVGTRPEAVKYVNCYTNEMYATLLLPAGITSEASIRFKDEAKLLEGVEDVDRTYVEDVLPRKMEYNLRSLRNFSLFGEMKTMVRTVFAVLGKEYK